MRLQREPGLELTADQSSALPQVVLIHGTVREDEPNTGQINQRDFMIHPTPSRLPSEGGGEARSTFCGCLWEFEDGLDKDHVEKVQR